MSCGLLHSPAERLPKSSIQAPVAFCLPSASLCIVTGNSLPPDWRVLATPVEAKCPAVIFQVLQQRSCSWRRKFTELRHDFGWDSLFLANAVSLATSSASGETCGVAPCRSGVCSQMQRGICPDWGLVNAGPYSYTQSRLFSSSLCQPRTAKGWNLSSVLTLP